MKNSSKYAVASGPTPFSLPKTKSSGCNVGPIVGPSLCLPSIDSVADSVSVGPAVGPSPIGPAEDEDPVGPALIGPAVGPGPVGPRGMPESFVEADEDVKDNINEVESSSKSSSSSSSGRRDHDHGPHHRYEAADDVVVTYDGRTSNSEELGDRFPTVVELRTKRDREDTDRASSISSGAYSNLGAIDSIVDDESVNDKKKMIRASE